MRLAGAFNRHVWPRQSLLKYGVTVTSLKLPKCRWFSLLCSPYFCMLRKL
ncbi:unnamed protein product, partial [Callosobruchus maculatus]